MGAVVVVGGFAAFDALRGGGRDGGAARPAATETATTANAEDTTTGSAVSLPGRIIYTDEGCKVREVDLATRTIAPVAESSCGLWGPPASGWVAYGVGRGDDFVTFRVVDVDAPTRRYGPFRARRGSVVWSRDGGAVAWCTPGGRAWEIVPGDEKPLPLPGCPVGYLPNGAPAFVRGREILAGDDTWLATAPGPVRFASFGSDSSLALLVRNEIFRYERVGDGKPTARVPVRDPFRDVPLFAPDNCAALLRSPHAGKPPTVTVVSLGCERRVDRRVLPGNEAVWSPEGDWFAVTEYDGPPAISFHTPAGATARNPVSAHANQIVWKERR